ncbi:MAG: MarR family winged helix-turn-helix transcriptional regulator [Antricoccus sp.]
MAEPRGPFNSPGFWLHHAALTWRRELDSRLVEIGLTHTQFNLLASANWLSRNGEQPTQQQTADLAGADRMMASKVLATLERHDLLERSPHPADPRAKRLRVTAAGATLVRRAVGIVADIDEEIFGPPSAQRDQLRDQLSGFTTSPNDQGKMDAK